MLIFNEKSYQAGVECSNITKNELAWSHLEEIYHSTELLRT